MDEERQDDQLEPIYNSFVLIEDIALKTNRERWTIETGGEKGSVGSALAAGLDDDDRYQNNILEQNLISLYSNHKLRYIKTKFIAFMQKSYSWCLVGCCRQDLFNIAHNIFCVITV